jgi:hypothetical protein
MRRVVALAVVAVLALWARLPIPGSITFNFHSTFFLVVVSSGSSSPSNLLARAFAALGSVRFWVPHGTKGPRPFWAEWFTSTVTV